jgi:hypothetical protein
MAILKNSLLLLLYLNFSFQKATVETGAFYGTAHDALHLDDE